MDSFIQHFKELGYLNQPNKEDFGYEEEPFGNEIEEDIVVYRNFYEIKQYHKLVQKTKLLHQRIVKQK